MSKRTITKRIPGGKTLQIDIDCNERINYVLISGDFFAYPEDFIDKLQEAITGKSISEAIKTITFLYKKMKPELLGISIDDIIDVLRKACA
ncbi:MAG TPA: hypothetical protein ENI59_01735 [Euryarchaeota archaeon]|nr:hypothetical protein [Euryarchaeota archaeon]